MMVYEIYGKAKFVPGCNHSMNLYGIHASVVNESAITFFGVIERFYAIFLFQSQVECFSSPLNVMMKPFRTACWRGHLEAIRAVITGFQEVIQALD